jgi:hypothetical protein
MVLGKNIKNLVILIPNEGHEDPSVAKDLRVVQQLEEINNKYC